MRGLGEISTWAKEWNNATQARRQPGSVAKLFVHLAALERGASPTQAVGDAPLSIGGRPVRNFDDRHLGGITMGVALARSSNTAAVRLAAGDTAGVRSVAERLGITADLSWCEAGDLAPGTWDARLVELVAAYAAVANGGFRVVPWTVQQVRGNDGAALFTRPAERPRERVIRAQHALEMRRMLAAVVRDGTGRAADPGFWAAGKTGTTSGHRDACFVGFTERHVAGVWLGNASSSALMDGVSGGGLPARIWRAVMIDAARA